MIIKNKTLQFIINFFLIFMVIYIITAIFVLFLPGYLYLGVALFLPIFSWPVKIALLLGLDVWGGCNEIGCELNSFGEFLFGLGIFITIPIISIIAYRQIKR